MPIYERMTIGGKNSKGGERPTYETKGQTYVPGTATGGRMAGMSSRELAGASLQGAALNELGKDLTKLGGSLYNLQDVYYRARATEIANEHKRTLSDLVDGENGLLSKKGSDAFGIADERARVAREDLDMRLKDQPEPIKKMAQNLVADSDLRDYLRVGQHQQQQVVAYGINQETSAINLANDMGCNADSDEEIKKYAGEIINRTQRIGEMQGASPEQIELNTKNNLDQYYTGVIKAKIQRKDVDGAERVFNSVSGKKNRSLRDGWVDRPTRNRENFNLGNVSAVGGGDAAYPNRDEGTLAVSERIIAYKGKGDDTLTKIISRYAPPNENDTAGYIAFVQKELAEAGFTITEPDKQPLDFSDPEFVAALTRAIIKKEGVGTVDKEESLRAAKRAIAGEKPKTVAPRRGPLTEGQVGQLEKQDELISTKAQLEARNLIEAGRERIRIENEQNRKIAAEQSQALAVSSAEIKGMDAANALGPTATPDQKMNAAIKMLASEPEEVRIPALASLQQKFNNEAAQIKIEVASQATDFQTKYAYDLSNYNLAKVEREATNAYNNGEIRQETYQKIQDLIKKKRSDPDFKAKSAEDLVSFEEDIDNANLSSMSPSEQEAYRRTTAAKYNFTEEDLKKAMEYTGEYEKYPKSYVFPLIETVGKTRDEKNLNDTEKNAIYRAVMAEKKHAEWTEKQFKDSINKQFDKGTNGLDGTFSREKRMYEWQNKNDAPYFRDKSLTPEERQRYADALAAKCERRGYLDLWEALPAEVRNIYVGFQVLRDKYGIVPRPTEDEREVLFDAFMTNPSFRKLSQDNTMGNFVDFTPTHADAATWWVDHHNLNAGDAEWVQDSVAFQGYLRINNIVPPTYPATWDWMDSRLPKFSPRIPLPGDIGNLPEGLSDAEKESSKFWKQLNTMRE